MHTRFTRLLTILLTASALMAAPQAAKTTRPAKPTSEKTTKSEKPPQEKRTKAAKQPTTATPPQAAKQPTAVPPTRAAILPAEQRAKKASTASAEEKATQAPAIGKAQLIDLNFGTRDELKSLPGMKEAYSEMVVDGRPYKKKKELLGRHIIPASVYADIQKLIVLR